MAIDEEYPILEYLILASTTSHLRSLALIVFGFLQMISRLLTTAVGPRHTLSYHGHPSIYLRPTALLQWLSFVPQLEMLLIHFLSPVPNRGVGGQVIRTPITTHVTLPNLRCFRFFAALGSKALART